jgi:DNA-binding NarL/FixJ family response regulator
MAVLRIVVHDERRLVREGLGRALASLDGVEVAGVVGVLDEVPPLCRKQASLGALVIGGSITEAQASRIARVLWNRHKRARLIIVTHGEHSFARLADEGPVTLVAERDGLAAVKIAIEAARRAGNVARGNGGNATAHWTAPTDWDLETDEPAAQASLLTTGEVQVLQLVGWGLTTREISEQLSISSKTVEKRKHEMCLKLGASNQAHAVAVATRRGLLVPSGAFTRPPGQ